MSWWQRNRQWCLVVAGFIIVWLWSVVPVAWWQGGGLQMWVLDVGQGDAIYLRLPSGRDVLIDGGPDASVLTELGAVMLPFDRELDYVILSHTDADHLTGLVPVLERYDVGQIVVGTSVGTSATYQAWDQRTVGRRVVVAGDAVALDDEVTMRVLWPTATTTETAANNLSLVFVLEYQDQRLLFSGDAEEAVEREIVDDVPTQITLLKVGHHGSQTSSIAPLLQKLQPEYAVVSVAAQNRYGHPHVTVMARLNQVSRCVATTARQGRLWLRFLNQKTSVNFSCQN